MKARSFELPQPGSNDFDREAPAGTLGFAYALAAREFSNPPPGRSVALGRVGAKDSWRNRERVNGGRSQGV